MISVITLNVNGLSVKTPIKRYCQTGKIKIQKPYYLQEMHFNIKTQIGFKRKDGKDIPDIDKISKSKNYHLLKVFSY